MRHYCTYFDRNYLLRGLALYRSLQRSEGPFVFHALCLDDHTFDILSRLRQPNLHPIALSEFEHGDAALLQAKSNRSAIEYYFTCTPSLMLYVLNHGDDVESVTYLNADMYFYSSVEPIYQELGADSILIIAHRFPQHLRFLEENGIYNVGWLTFRNDPAGRECAQWWRERCIEWCYDRLEDGKFADQKYLDDWPQRFEGVVVLQHKGANLAPWNWMNYDIRFTRSGITVDGQPLIFYHFHGLKILRSWLYDPVSEGRLYGEMPFGMRWRLYHPYIQAIKAVGRWTRELLPDATFAVGNRRIVPYNWKKMVRKVFEARLMFNFGLE
jgi:hypothetical protein